MVARATPALRRSAPPTIRRTSTSTSWATSPAITGRATRRWRDGRADDLQQPDAADHGQPRHERAAVAGRRMAAEPGAADGGRDIARGGRRAARAVRRG